MIVWNDFRNDARVLKEAETLQAAGYEVTVYALHALGLTQKVETLESGIKVRRVPRNPFYRGLQEGGAIQSNQRRKNYSIDKLFLSSQLVKVTTRMWVHVWLLIKLVWSRPDVIHGHDVNTLPARI